MPRCSTPRDLRLDPHLACYLRDIEEINQLTTAKKNIIENIYFKPIISQHNVSFARYLPSAWVPVIFIHSGYLSFSDGACFCFLFITTFSYKYSRFWNLFFPPNHTSVTVYVLKPHTLAKRHGTKSILGGVSASAKPPSSFAYSLFQIFHVHKIPGSLLSASEDSSHTYLMWKWKATAFLTPLCFLVMVRASLSEDGDYFHSSPLAATVTVKTTLYNACFPHDVALKGCDPRQNVFFLWISCFIPPIPSGNRW